MNTQNLLVSIKFENKELKFAMSGEFGTLDAMYEAPVLIQCKKK